MEMKLFLCRLSGEFVFMEKKLQDYEFILTYKGYAFDVRVD